MACMARALIEKPGDRRHFVGSRTRGSASGEDITDQCMCRVRDILDSFNDLENFAVYAWDVPHHYCSDQEVFSDWGVLEILAFYDWFLERLRYFYNQEMGKDGKGLHDDLPKAC